MDIKIGGKMVEIKLGNNNAFKWVNDGTNYAIGYAFYKDKLLNAEEILNLVNKQKDTNELIGIIKSLNGAFSIVIKQDNSYYLITDIIASFPILYAHNKTHTLISDDINNFTNSKLNENKSYYRFAYVATIRQYTMIYFKFQHQRLQLYLITTLSKKLSTLPINAKKL